MSCITEILKLKGDKEFFPCYPDEYSAVIEGGGFYKGYDYLITFTDMGARCGYVALPSDSKLKTQEQVEDLIDCHGGITFFSEHHPAKELLTTPCNDFWIGFDCLHFGDLADIESHKKYFKDSERYFFHQTINKLYLDSRYNSRIRDFKYVENECKSIIDQLANGIK